MFDGFDCCDTPEAKGDDFRVDGATPHAVHYMRCWKAVLQKITHPSAGGVGLGLGSSSCVLLLPNCCSRVVLSKASWLVLSYDSAVIS